MSLQNTFDKAVNVIHHIAHGVGITAHTATSAAMGAVFSGAAGYWGQVMAEGNPAGMIVGGVVGAVVATGVAVLLKDAADNTGIKTHEEIMREDNPTLVDKAHMVIPWIVPGLAALGTVGAHMINGMGS